MQVSPRFSICIPNFNYANYVGITIASVLSQDLNEFEIIVSDNCSTDASLETVNQIGDPRVHVFQNACNVGFARNLDRAAGRANGQLMIMLSSDDLIEPGALRTYDKFFSNLGEAGTRAVLSATWNIVDSDGKVIGRTGPNRRVWRESDRLPELDALAGGPVYCVAADELLKRSMMEMMNPFNFAATCYPRELYQAVEGYGGGRMINPDRWFHWRILARADRAYFIDRPLFSYRWHATNQTAQQASEGSLKYMVDEYATTLEVDAEMLARAAISKDQLVAAFVEHDVAGHGLATLARGDRIRAKRILGFGTAVYPKVVARNSKAKILRWLLRAGPLGQYVAQQAYRARLANEQKAAGGNGA